MKFMLIPQPNKGFYTGSVHENTIFSKNSFYKYSPDAFLFATYITRILYQFSL